MKFKIISFLLLAICLSSIVKSQTFYVKPTFAWDMQKSQMWNTSSTYSLTVTSSNLGSQLDTVTNTTALTLQIASFVTPSFTATPLNGTGKITFHATVLKCTGSPTVTCTLVSGITTNHLVAIPGQTVYTLVPTSLTVPNEISWYGIDKSDRHYGVLFNNSGSSTISVQSGYIYLPNQTYQISK